MISLTFDDGPGPTTNRILDILQRFHIEATFFVTGKNLVDTPWDCDTALGWSICKRMLTEGHLIGNHTFSHSNNHQSEIVFLKEILDVDNLIFKLHQEVGKNVRKLPVRLPFGIIGDDIRLTYLASIGRSHFHWSKNFNDWHEGEISSLFFDMITYVEEREALGLDSVLDLHDSGIGNVNGYKREATADALEKFAYEAVSRNWRFFVSPV